MLLLLVLSVAAGERQMSAQTVVTSCSLRERGREHICGPEVCGVQTWEVYGWEDLEGAKDHVALDSVGEKNIEASALNYLLHYHHSVIDQILTH